MQQRFQNQQLVPQAAVHHINDELSLRQLQRLRQRQNKFERCSRDEAKINGDCYYFGNEETVKKDVVLRTKSGFKREATEGPTGTDRTAETQLQSVLSKLWLHMTHSP